MLYVIYLLEIDHFNLTHVTECNYFMATPYHEDPRLVFYLAKATHCTGIYNCNSKMLIICESDKFVPTVNKQGQIKI